MFFFYVYFNFVNFDICKIGFLVESFFYRIFIYFYMLRMCKVYES